VIPEIKKESDYEKFHFASFNRSLVRATINKLKSEFKKENNFMYFPIIVDKDMAIIDGQHRFTVSKELNLPIYYMVKDKRVMPSDIRTVNKAGTKHSLRDIFEMECLVESPEALKIKSLGEELGDHFDLGSLLSLCLDVANGGQIRDRLENGKYRLIDYKKSKDIGFAILKLTNSNRVNTTIYNAIRAIAKINNLSMIDLLSDITNKGLVINSKMSKTIIVNKITETYNFRKYHSNKIKTP